MYKFNYLYCFSLVMVLAGCSSNHSANDSVLGAGYYDKKLAPGIHLVTVTGRGDMFDSVQGLEKTWRGRANTLCNYKEYNILEYDLVLESNPYAPVSLTVEGVYFVVGGNKIPKMSGIIFCNDSGYKKDQAMKLVDDYFQYQKPDQDVNYPTDECSVQEKWLEAGREFLENGKCESALACFYQLTENLNRSNTVVPKTELGGEAQYYMGFMLENGFGIIRNIEAARRWYRKASLSGSVQAMNRLTMMGATSAKLQ